MALKQTATHMMELLEKVYEDLVKAVEKENKAAAQRVRTGSIRLEKVAKLFRKESVKEMPKKKRATKAKAKKPAAKGKKK
ncbi:MAG: hypothetical protein FJZ62_04735 [Chlamydiae bacterium]|jgi:hypothetical protein|nr:hypothetical protein [Chlamydiota bacterium]